jgi:hypothetical protein
MAKGNKRNITNRSQGHLADELFKQKKRLDALESNGKPDNNNPFGMNPWVVLGSVFAFLVVSFGGVYSWQIDRIDRVNKEKVERISKEYESRISWLKEQQKKDNGFSEKQCKYELDISNNRLSACMARNKELASNQQGITKQ